MVIFNFTNFERQGNTENDIQLDSVAEISAAILSNAEKTL